MSSRWRVIYYGSGRGEKPVQDFIELQQKSTQIKIIRLLEHLEEFGVQIGPPHVKKLTETELWELRIMGANNIRIFYIAVEQQVFLLLHAFKKKKQKTDKREIRSAQERLVEYRARKRN
ncbi:type II toxin-antitoxin system RelE/ParE family toxin [Patescibacteria group bacterium]|nr:type II toxin-antitoxin system RelE/ParE family toxin [Patescibacteria group bacterium]MBU4016286.1 type II toxin-antitoxin system RelE/ParE family toxin [Patescibacteria group bacterium]MBU4098331.1 type II toxin-antitoxin system RelE/ParE family toxin [Patescibacteria group bacterium]